MKVGLLWGVLVWDILILLSILWSAGRRIFCTGGEDGIFIRGVKLSFITVLSLECITFFNMLFIF